MNVKGSSTKGLVHKKKHSHGLKNQGRAFASVKLLILSGL